MASVVLAVLVAVLSLALGFSGMHESNPIVYGLVFIALAMLFNAGCVVWGLKMTAAENPYLKQLMNAAGIGLVAGVLIFLFSFLMLSVLLPDHIAESNLAMVDFLDQQQLPEAQKAAQIAKLEDRTPVSEATSGLIGTFITSLVIGAIAAIFLRKK